MRIKDLCSFIEAREKVRMFKDREIKKGKADKITRIKQPKKAKKLDPIITKYRFCNVRRNFDRVSVWVQQEWMHPNAKEKDLWFAMVVARLFNLPSTLAEIGFPKDFNPKKMKKKLHKIKARGDKVFNAAYIVSTNGKSMDKIDYIVDLVLKPMWKKRKKLRPYEGQSLDAYHKALMKFDGMGSFMAAQVIADLKYADAPLIVAPDFEEFAASGPGSRRGMNRVMGREVKASQTEANWRADLAKLRKKVNKKLGWLIPITGHDLQNCLCEFDKYERARLGEGKPKQIYKPHKEK